MSLQKCDTPPPPPPPAPESSRARRGPAGSQRLGGGRRERIVEDSTLPSVGTTLTRDNTFPRHRAEGGASAPLGVAWPWVAWPFSLAGRGQLLGSQHFSSHR